MPQRPLSSRPVDTPPDRRTFLKACGAAAGSLVLAPLSGCQQAPPTPEPASRPSHLVQFGHTDLWVSRHCQGTAFRRHLNRRGRRRGGSQADPALHRPRHQLLRLRRRLRDGRIRNRIGARRRRTAQRGGDRHQGLATPCRRGAPDLHQGDSDPGSAKPASNA